jgi:hypothetical protein
LADFEVALAGFCHCFPPEGFQVEAPEVHMPPAQLPFPFIRSAEAAVARIIELTNAIENATIKIFIFSSLALRASANRDYNARARDGVKVKIAGQRQKSLKRSGASSV